MPQATRLGGPMRQAVAGSLHREVIPASADLVSSLRRTGIPQEKWRCPKNGGERVRTDDPLLAKQVLSQLSYTPAGTQLAATKAKRAPHRSTVTWWAREDLNLRPHAYQACALTS